MSWTGTVTCSHCYQQGHNRRGCPSLKKYVKDNPDSYTARSEGLRKSRESTRACGYCRNSGHNRKTCPERKGHALRAVEVNREWVKRATDYLKEKGIGPGALVTVYSPHGTNMLGLVVGFNYDSANFLSVSNSYTGDFVIVSPVDDLTRRSCARLPGDAELVVKDEPWGRHRIIDVNSPVPSQTIEDYMEGDLLFKNGFHGISSLFEETRHNAPLREIEELEQKYFEKS
jgi:hypothetical protein